jgi:hypothetical protein
MSESSSTGSDKTFNAKPFSYEEEGFAMGVLKKEEEKKRRIEELEALNQRLVGQHTQLCTELTGSIEGYTQHIEQLLDKEMTKSLDTLQDRIDTAMLDLVLAREGLMYLLNAVHDERQRAEFIEEALNKYRQTVEEAKSNVRTLFEKIKDELNPQQVKQALVQHLAEQHKLVEDTTKTFEKREELTRGYNRGHALSLIFESKRAKK